MNWEMGGRRMVCAAFLNACKYVVPNKYFKIRMGIKKMA